MLTTGKYASSRLTHSNSMMRKFDETRFEHATKRGARPCRTHAHADCHLSLSIRKCFRGSSPQGPETARSDGNPVQHSQGASVRCKPVRNLPIVLHIKHSQ